MQLLLSALTLVLGTYLLRSVERRYRFFLASLIVINALLLGVYFIANRLTDNGIDDSVLYHVMWGLTGAGLGQFLSEFVIGFLWVVASGIVVAWLFLQPKQPRSLFLQRIGVLAFAFSFVINPAVGDLLTLLDTEDTPLPPSGFVKLERLPETNNEKNLVYVYLESVERTYLDDALFPGLVPNLKKLESEGITFTNIHQADATGWTIAGMVASQCGVPLVTSSGDNSMVAMDRFMPEVICLGDLLAAWGYHLSYLGGASLRFGGKGNFYRSHGFTEVKGLTSLQERLTDPGYVNNWGLYDDSLFSFAQAQIADLLTQGEPFGLFLLTLDTHHPLGHVSRDCSGESYGDGTNSILNSVHCTDRLLGRFVSNLRKMSPDLLIVISSDHLAMPNTASSILDQKERRNLLVVLDETLSGQQVSKAGSMLDVTPTLLSMMGVDLPALGLGQNLLLDQEAIDPTLVNQQIQKNRGFFNQLWSFPGLDAGIEIDPVNNQLRMGGRKLSLPALIQLEDDLQVKDILFEAFSPNTLLFSVRQMSPTDDFIWIDECADMIWLGEVTTEQSWCLASGSLASRELGLMVLDEETSLSNLELLIGTTEADLSVMFRRLGKLQKLISSKQLPAH